MSGEQAELDNLREHWGSAYAITITRSGRWQAIRRGQGWPDMVLDYPTADALRSAIRADYAERGEARLRP